MSQALRFNAADNLARTHCLVITLRPLPISPQGDVKPQFSVVEVATWPMLTFRMRFPVEGGQRSEFDPTLREMMDIQGNYFGALGVLSYERPGFHTTFMALIPGVFDKRDRWPVIGNWLNILA